MIVHAGLIALFDAGGWRGALIEGPSGVGKSDLALRAMDVGRWRLVADDRVRLFVSAGRLFGRAPTVLAGRIEARGLGVVARPALLFSRIDLLVTCLAEPETPERVPERRTATLLGVEIPRLAISARAASAAILLTTAMGGLEASSELS